MMDVSLEPAAPAPDSCRVCGCTDHDCSQCVARTGAPCYWVMEGMLCSACATLEQLLERSLELVRAGEPLQQVSRLTLLASARASDDAPVLGECMACEAGVEVGHWLHDCADEGANSRALRLRVPIAACHECPWHRAVGSASCCAAAELEVIDKDADIYGERPSWCPLERQEYLITATTGTAAAAGQAPLTQDDANAHVTGHVARPGRGPAEHVAGGGAGMSGAGVADAGVPVPTALLREARLQHVQGRGRELWRVSAAIASPSKWIEHGEVAVRVQWDFSGGPAVIHADLRAWFEGADPLSADSDQCMVLTIGEARYLAHVLHRASYRAQGQPGPMMRAGDDGFRLWRGLAELVGDPALAFDPELLVSRVAERFSILEACKMPEEPELGALARAAAGLPSELIGALREVAESLLGEWPVEVPFRAAMRHLAEASVLWMQREILKAAISIYEDVPVLIQTVLSHAGYLLDIETIAAWPTERRREALAWAMRHPGDPPAAPPSFLDPQSDRGDA